MDYTVNNLVTKIKLWASVPGSQPAFTSAQMISVLNDEMYNVIVPFIMQNMEEFLVTYYDYTITSSKSAYEIPTRAIGNILREINLVNSEGDYSRIPRIEPNHLEKHTFGFYMQGDNVKIIKPEDYTSYTLRMFYYRRPNELLDSTDTTYGTRQITSITTATNTIGFASLPAAWTSAITVDIIKGTPPFSLLAENQAITTGVNSIVLASLPTGLAVGDWVAYTGYSPIAMLPYEVYGLLAQSVVIKIMESLADQKGTQLAVSKYQQMEDRIKKLLSPRVHGEAKKIVNYDSFI